MLRPSMLPLVVLGIALVVTFGSPSRADGLSTKPPTAAEIAKWIKDLDSDDFSTRREATVKLIAAGPAAIEQVAKAAEGESLEVTTRCLDVLGKLLASPNAATKAAAKKALEGLAKSTNAAIARRAEDLVNPKAPTPPPQPAPALAPGRIRLRMVRMSVRNVNGQKTIEAEEGGRKVKIEEAADGGIKMQVTETVDGKEKTSKYEAKNAEELKKKHPDAHKLYEKYGKQRGVVRRLGRPGGARPFRIGPIPQKALDQIEAARKQLDQATEKLRKLAGESRIDPERVKKLAEEIDAAKKQLEEAQQQLGK